MGQLGFILKQMSEAAEPDEGEGGDTRRRGAGGDGVFFESHRDEYFQKEGRAARKESG